MGIDRWSYLGPYAELTLTMNTVRRDTCPKPAECPNPTDAPFCPTCGMVVSKRFVEFQSADPPLPDFLWKELHEALFCADGMAGPERLDAQHVIYRIIGNVTRDGQPREFHLDQNGDFWLDMSTLDPRVEMAWFKRAFAPELHHLQETYGGFHIRWGLLQWFS